MREGWFENKYLILFEPDEIDSTSRRYSFPKLLPGYRLLGIRDWDDFIVEDSEGQVFTVPTVPLAENHRVAYQLPKAEQELLADAQFTGKIKWYVKPLVFGGDSSHQNQTWINHDQHAQMVCFWNDVYRSVAAARP